MLDSKVIFDSTYLKCTRVYSGLDSNEHWKDAYKPEFIRFQATPEGYPQVIECRKPQEFSPVLSCIFSYLSSNYFRRLASSTKSVYSLTLRLLFSYLDKNENIKNINKNGFWKDYFQTLSDRGSTTAYNETIRLLRSSCEKYEEYKVPYGKEIKNLLREIPSTVNIDSIPRETLGEKFFGRKNSALKEKRLYQGLNAFIEEAATMLMYYNSALYEYYDDKLPQSLELWHKENKNRAWKDQPNSIREMTFPFIEKAYLEKDEIILFFHPVTTEKFSEKKPSQLFSKFKSKRFNKLIVTRRNKANKEERLSLSIQFLKPTHLLVPSNEELVIFKFLLAKWQFTPAMITTLKPINISENATIRTIQISEDKDRSGSNPESTRGHQVIFRKDQHRFEYEFCVYMMKKIHLSYEYKGLDTHLDPISKLGIMASKSWKTIGTLFESPNSLKFELFSDKAKHFITTWITQKKKKNLESPCSFSIGGTHISQTVKVLTFDYQITQKDDIQGSNSNEEINSKTEANQRAHTLETDINIYEARNLSPVLLEADHRVGQQVADLMTREAKDISARLKVMTLYDVRSFYGLTTTSEEFSNSDFTEFLELTGKDITEYLGIESGDEIIIVQHPIVLAMMKLYIEHIDSNLSELIVDQGSPLSDKVIQIEALRVVIASMIENFDDVLHTRADKIIADYDFPVFPPLI